MQLCGPFHAQASRSRTCKVCVPQQGSGFTCGMEVSSTRIRDVHYGYRNRRRILLAIPAVTRAPIPASASPSA